MRLVRDWPEVGVLVERVADTQRRDPVLQRLEKRPGQASVGQHLAAPFAPLAVQLGQALEDAVGRHVDVGVLQDEHGVVASELELQDLEVLGRGSRDRTARSRTAGERDHLDAWVRGQPGADVAGAVHQLEGARGQACGDEALDDDLGTAGCVLCANAPDQ